MGLSEKIQIISASAGSGKTYRLAELLEQEVKQGRVRPDAILATTFTKKAAAELQERVRTRLLAADLVTQAQQLAASRMGTVNSVCGGLLVDFAFDLGISPNQQVLDEEVVLSVINRAMSRGIDKAMTKQIWQVEQKFPGTQVRDVVANIIAKARANRITPEQLSASAQRSCGEFLELFGVPAGDGAKLNRELALGLDNFLAAVDPELDTTQATQGALSRVRAIKNKLNQHKRLPWHDWLALQKVSTGAKSRAAAEALTAVAAQHDQHPFLRADITQLIELVFTLAAKTMVAYQEYKSEWGVVDFIDQEALFLDLLEMDGPAAIISDHLDLVLVDEFQDTSPIQLAIFMKLAELAKKSVWVGDQKQSVYGFRDADPSLMDAAIEGILGKKEPETLPFSWRSRPELVCSTSDIFAQAFTRQGFPERQVRLEPAEKVINTEPAGLSSIYEYWLLQSKNKDNDALALAKATRDLLAEPNNTVRDPQTGEKRPVRGGDVAILCRANDVCVTVAGALEEQGIDVALARPGLLNQPEVIVSMAGVRLVMNPRDSLARAEIARFFDGPEDNDAFLQKALALPYAQGFELDVFDRLGAAQKSLGLAGPLEVLDTVFEALSIRAYCHAWGDGKSRLANLDSFRSHCVRYVDECQGSGQGVSTVGMLAWLADQGELAQAEVKSENSVQVLTWHKAKGLEWPVTVLFQLNKVYPALPLGVNAVSDQDFVLDDPLGGRWLRYWPDPYLDPANPFAVTSSGASFHTRLDADQVTIAHKEKEERQELRLLYVGWTRARDKVVFAGRKAALQKGIMRLLVDGNGDHLLADPDADKAIWAGREVDVALRVSEPTGAGAVSREVEPESCFVESGSREHPPAFLPASSVQKAGVVRHSEILGERLPLNGRPDMQHVGESFHGFLAADIHDRIEESRLKMAVGLLERWQTESNITAEDMLIASDRLNTWIKNKWPEAKWHKEYPVASQQESGTVISGFIDLLLEVADGYVIIDHKSFPGSRDKATKKAETFGGQLGVYAEGVKKATGREVLGCYIHLPVSGMCCEITS